MTTTASSSPTVAVTTPALVPSANVTSAETISPVCVTAMAVGAVARPKVKGALDADSDSALPDAVAVAVKMTLLPASARVSSIEYTPSTAVTTTGSSSPTVAVTVPIALPSATVIAAVITRPDFDNTTELGTAAALKVNGSLVKASESGRPPWVPTALSTTVLPRSSRVRVME